MAALPLRSRRLGGYFWSAGGIAIATEMLWLARHSLDNGQASLLYLPAVIACAIRFGFGPSVVGAVLSFMCWDFFFLPPRFTLIVRDPKDWLSLIVFLVAAVTTAGLASRSREQTAEAQAREQEILRLFEASETISREIEAGDAIAALAEQVQALCRTNRCIVWRLSGSSRKLIPMEGAESPSSVSGDEQILAEATVEFGQPIGFDRSSSALWSKALGDGAVQSGVYVPLLAEKKLVGVVHVGARPDGKPFTQTERRLILTLANHAAVVIARESLAQSAAQAEALREADVLKDALLSMVSHELRSPLAAIKATATGLRRQLGESAADELGIIDTEADRLSTLVGNLLDLSRLEAGAWKPDRDWCDTGEILGTALDRLSQPTADRVKISTSDELPLIRADYTQITIVLTNILENAAKYSPPQSAIDLTIQPANDGSHAAQSGVTIQVRDYGRGIAPGEEDVIFTRFFRSGDHRRSAVRGSGLGLALCEAIVRAHNGKIWAANAPDDQPSGAVFTVYLPTE